MTTQNSPEEKLKGNDVFISMKDGPDGQTGFLAKMPPGSKVSFSKGPDGELEMVPEPDTEPPTLTPMKAKDYQGDAYNASTVDLRRANGPMDNVYIENKSNGLLSAYVGGEAKLRQGITAITEVEATAAVPDYTPPKNVAKLGTPS